MGRPIRALCLSFALALATGEAFAASAPAGEMMLEINDSQRVGLYGSATSVIVGNPQVADVSMLDSHSFVVSAKGFGATRVQVFDTNGRELFNRRIVVTAPTSNQVTLYRGSSTSDFDCSPKCHAVSGQMLASQGPLPPAGNSTSTTTTTSTSNYSSETVHSQP
jgi:hypothetical protein